MNTQHIPADVIKRAQEISNETQNEQSECIDRLMNEQTVFLEQLKREQEMQLEAQQRLMDVMIAEKHKTLRQVDGKLKRGSNHQPKKEKEEEMTTEEYISVINKLKEEKRVLCQNFINDNEFSELNGKLVYLRTGCKKEKVLFSGVGVYEVRMNSAYGKLCLFYYKLKKNGSPYKVMGYIPVERYDGKIYKIEKIL